MSKKVSIVFIAIFLVLALAACADENDLLRQEVLKDLKKDISIIKNLELDPAPLKEALTGKALLDFANQTKADMDSGKLKKRAYENVKLEVTKVEKGKVAQALFEFDDVSYYVSSQDNTKVLSPAQKRRLKLKLHLAKDGGRWKIAVIYPVEDAGPKVAPLQ